MPTHRLDSSTLNSSGEVFLAVGLGNPDGKYAGTRHNVGAMALASLVSSAGQSWSNKSGNQIASIRFGSRKIICARLGCYMNVSGPPTASLMRYYKIPAHNLLVLHDDLDLDLGRLRLKIGGGEGGHNGLRSISGALASKEYMRLRLGVGRPPERMPVADYVLQRFKKNELLEVETMIARAVQSVEQVVNLGLAKAQMQLHSGTN